MAGRPVNDLQLHYEIRVLGRISPDWAEWFGGLDLATAFDQDGITMTILTGIMVDQSALFGVLNRLRDLGLKLISVNQVNPH